jgi:ubiquinone/menaquinone biosynthesis C-methylase UbiE
MVAAGAAARSERLVRAVARRTRRVADVHVLDLKNSRGEGIRAIADFPGEAPTPGAPLVLIPPAWGRTKETLLPLAATIVATFEKAGRQVSVVRFDGVRKRGESYNDPECRASGKEHHRFTFSQGVDDILAVLDELARNPAFAPSKVVLTTFSAASIDGRRAIVADTNRRIDGWVSVVGSPDIQSMMRIVSGGVDYIGGSERGLSFGIQEVLGVEVDIDLAGQDALRAELAFLEDSCRDMSAIRVPVTWIHGRHDAWMDLNRVRTMLSRGDASSRKLIVVPTGHQLRTSREALEVFQLIAEEVSKICVGVKLRGRLPNLVELEGRRKSERDRLPQPQVDQHAFWKRYLLGRDGSIGIELMTNASYYRQFMREQIAELGISGGGLVADLGSGTGAFLACAAELPTPLRPIVVHELDYVREAFPRARATLGLSGSNATLRASFINCDLAADGKRLSIPCRDSTYDAAIASLFISYVSDPLVVLSEVSRILKPGGRLVVSGLRRDADVSKLFVDAIEEIGRGQGASQSSATRELDIELASRNFLNDASRLLDLEENGLFRFRDATELCALLRDAGFSVDKVWDSFGDPPQAVVVSARKP